jgi:hypothetical protein
MLAYNVRRGHDIRRQIGRRLYRCHLGYRHIQEIAIGQRKGLRIEELPLDEEVATVPCGCEPHSRAREKLIPAES